jgi:hypothetical protein
MKKVILIILLALLLFAPALSARDCQQGCFAEARNTYAMCMDGIGDPSACSQLAAGTYQDCMLAHMCMP